MTLRAVQESDRVEAEKYVDRAVTQLVVQFLTLEAERFKDADETYAGQCLMVAVRLQGRVF